MDTSGGVAHLLRVGPTRRRLPYIFREQWFGPGQPRDMTEEQVQELMTQPTLVRTYRSERFYQEDASMLARYGFRPTSVAARQQSRGSMSCFPT